MILFIRIIIISWEMKNLKESLRKAISVLLCAAVLLSAVAVSLTAFADSYEKIEYGYYPQKVLDPNNKSEGAIINSLTAKLKDEDWKAFDYYSGDGTEISAHITEYTYYADVTLHGALYRAVKFTEFRPDMSYGVFGELNSSDYPQYKNGYSEKNKVYWFKYQPIVWNVLDRSSGLLMSESVLDAQSANGLNSNDMPFAQTELFAWLNGDFAETAFTDEEASFIIGKVRILTASEATDSSYGFTAGITSLDANRTAIATDYAAALGEPHFQQVNGIYPGPYWIDDESAGDTSASLYAAGYTGSATKTPMQKVRGVRAVINLNISASNTVFGKTPVTYYYDPDCTLAHTDYYTPGDSITPYSPAGITGYQFKGWDEKPPQQAGSDKLVYYANWEANTHTVTFDASGGKFNSNNSETLSKDVKYNQPIPAETPVKQGYDFSSWDDEIPATMPDNDLSFKAVWTPSTNTHYSVTVYKQNADDDGYTAEVTDCKGTTEAPVSVTPDTIEHFVYNESKSKTSDEIAPDGSTDLAIYYDRETHTVTFNFNDGATQSMTNTYKYGQSVSIPRIPSKYGYATEGWRDADGKTPVSPCEGDAVYSLEWEKGKFSIQYYDSDGVTPLDGQTYIFEQPVTAPEDPQKEGYTFMGWTPALPETMPGENLEVKAVWKVNTYKATYYIDGEQFATRNVDYGTAVPLLNAPAKEGYAFTWTDKPATMPASNIEINGTYTICDYTATFKVDGREYNTQTVTFGQAITVPAAPSKSGYIFKGWSPEIPATMPGRDMTFTAQFIKEPSIAIAAYKSKLSVGWKTTVKFHVVVDADSYDRVIWIIGSNEYTDDGSLSYTVKSATQNYKIQCRLIAGDLVKESAVEEVNVDARFVAKIIYFFRNIFAASKLTLDQK